VRKARERAVKGIAVTARRGGKIIDLFYARRNMVGDAQSGHHVDEPRSAEITQ
jgi:hypothetical protein